VADSELGELRRPTRPVEYRIERLARWRAQGLAGGTSDSVFPADAVDDALASDGSGEGDGGDPPSWFADSFDVTSVSGSALTLTYQPIPYSEVIRLNGVTLDPLTEYTIDGRVVTLTDLADLLLGIGADTWVLVASYAYIDTAEPTLELLYTQSDEISIVSIGHTLSDEDVCVVFVVGDTTSISGYAATWTKVYDGGASGSFIDVWIGTGVGTGTTITRTGASGIHNGSFLAVLDGAGGIAPTVTALQANTVTAGTFTDPHVISGSATAGKLLATVLRIDTTGHPDAYSTWTISGLTDVEGDESHGGGIYVNGTGVAIGTQDDTGSFSVTIPMVTFTGGGSTYVFQIEAAS
jgi:hypothetical protein